MKSMTIRFSGGVVLSIALVALASGGQRIVSAEQAAALKIVVVEGEGAVNIIQQKTAVAPVIEVRDRNDQPVAGAVVKFAITKGRASFNGARTLSVTTNAVGRATAAGLTPTASGPLQIAASAAFQGQTAAITIAQTTVATAAEASSVAAGTSAASASGGGLSHTALAAILGGAGAGVAGVALAAKGASSDSPSGPPSIFTLRTINGAALPVVILPECQLGGPPCAPCIMTATAGTLTLTPPNEFNITLTTTQTCVDPLGRSPTSAGPTLTNIDTGEWSTQADGTITFRSGGLLNARSATQSGSLLTVSFDWLANNPGTANVPVATQWSK
jgi:hypothetical protein